MEWDAKKENNVEYEVQTHLVNSRLALWCPVCGAKEGQACTHVKGNRFDAHNEHAVVRSIQAPGLYGTPRNLEPYRPKPQVVRHDYREFLA